MVEFIIFLLAITAILLIISDTTEDFSSRIGLCAGVAVFFFFSYFFMVYIPEKREGEEIKRKNEEVKRKKFYAECVPDKDLHDLARSNTEPNLLKIRVAEIIENDPCITRRKFYILREEVSNEMANRELESRKRQEDTDRRQGDGHRALMELRHKHEQRN